MSGIHILGWLIAQMAANQAQAFVNAETLAPLVAMFGAMFGAMLRAIFGAMLGISSFRAVLSFANFDLTQSLGPPSLGLFYSAAL